MIRTSFLILISHIFVALFAQNIKNNYISPVIHGVLLEGLVGSEGNVRQVKDGKNVTIEIFGQNLDSIQEYAFTDVAGTSETSCQINSFMFDKINSESTSYHKYFFRAPETTHNYLCVKINDEWLYPRYSSNETLIFEVVRDLIPLYGMAIIAIFLLMLSGLFSGLNLGLMALGKTELKIIETAGSEKEKKYAKQIRPIREKGNLLLCSLLFGNVLVNSALSILIDNIFANGIYSIIGATIAITFCGEIIPQAVCTRHGLAVGAKTIWLTKIFIILTFPASFPVSFVLDKVLGEEFGVVYNRNKLCVLIKEQVTAGTVANDEMNIITGALAITTKTVESVMTPLQDAFMIEYDAILNFTTMNEIFASGFTRIPVYETDRRDIRAVLNVKDLAFIDIEDNIPVSTICKFYNRSILVVPNKTNLETMLKEFRQGKAHMAFVELLINDGPEDPYREVIGLVTLEDVIEEIIQAEIMDETDVLTDNVNKQKRYLRKRDFRIFNYKESSCFHFLSPQLKIAALRHLVSNVTSFNEEFINMPILQSLLNANILIKQKFEPYDDLANIIYYPNTEYDYFILILQGKAKITISAVEELSFEVGPFYNFGEPALIEVNKRFGEILKNSSEEKVSNLNDILRQTKFKADFSLNIISDIEYLKITAEHYALARILSQQQAKVLAPAKSLSLMTNLDQKPESFFQGTVADYIQANPHLTNVFQKAWESHTAKSCMKRLDDCNSSSERSPERLNLTPNIEGLKYDRRKSLIWSFIKDPDVTINTTPERHVERTSHSREPGKRTSLAYKGSDITFKIDETKGFIGEVNDSKDLSEQASN